MYSRIDAVNQSLEDLRIGDLLTCSTENLSKLQTRLDKIISAVNEELKQREQRKE